MHENLETREGWVPYLVEGYRPGASVETLAGAARQLRVAIEQMAEEGMPLRYVRSTIIPSDESCLFFVEAASERLIRDAYARAGVDFERISTAIPVEEIASETRAKEGRGR